MSDLGLNPREVWKQPDRLPAEGRLGRSKNKKEAAFFVACLAFFAYTSLVWHSETGNLTWLMHIRLPLLYLASIISFWDSILVILRRFWFCELFSCGHSVVTELSQDALSREISCLSLLLSSTLQNPQIDRYWFRSTSSSRILTKIVETSSVTGAFLRVRLELYTYKLTVLPHTTTTG
jgi:hypothetical protein